MPIGLLHNNAWKSIVSQWEVENGLELTNGLLRQVNPRPSYVLKPNKTILRAKTLILKTPNSCVLKPDRQGLVWFGSKPLTSYHELKMPNATVQKVAQSLAKDKGRKGKAYVWDAVVADFDGDGKTEGIAYFGSQPFDKIFGEISSVIISPTPGAYAGALTWWNDRSGKVQSQLLYWVSGESGLGGIEWMTGIWNLDGGNNLEIITRYSGFRREGSSIYRYKNRKLSVLAEAGTYYTL